MMLSMLMPLMVPIAAWGATATFYVSPDGNDGHDGTESAPFATLLRAREAIRTLSRRGLRQDVVVYLRAGVHSLPRPFALGAQDSGTNIYPIVYAAYPGEKPVISGGQAITGWTRGEDNRWHVVLPEVQAGNWRFRQLFCDGVRLPRARFPNGDELLTVERVNPEVTEIVLNQDPHADSLPRGDAELVVYQNWSITRVLIRVISGAVVQTMSPVGWIGHGDATTASPGKPCYVENALAFVDAPGEWYLDRSSGVLTYQAAEGEDPNEHSFVAPRLNQLLWVAGRPDAPVINVHFRGLSFEYTEWPLPEFGYMGIQAGHHGTSMSEPVYVLPLAVHFLNAEDCQVVDCRIAHTGACGIGFGAGCRRNKVIGSIIEDIGGNGVMVGWRGDLDAGRIDFTGEASLSADWEEDSEVPQGNEIRNCTIRRCGGVNHGCVGIFDAFSTGTRISHNLVTDLPYTGISIGFRWDESPTHQSNCTVEYNHVYDVMKKLADGGAIYTLGYQPGTVLRGNLLHGVHRSVYAHGGAPNNGIFFDQGSKGYLVEGNIVYDTSGEPIRFNQTSKENMTWKDNFFGVAPGDPSFPEAAAKKAGPQ